MKNIYKILTILCFGLVMSSCYYDDFEPTIVDDIEIPVGTVITFKADIAPILNGCTQCHGGSTSPDMRNTQNAYNGLIANYVKKGNAAGSRLYTFAPGSPTSGHPNVGVTLTATQLGTIKAWIDTDAKFE
ncbi:MAG: hypothetical protein NDI80_09325 [Flavobacteriaceae bacterium]|nr:hypothetical protein [Flavobacteriaceae bacterium]